MYIVYQLYSVFLQWLTFYDNQSDTMPIEKNIWGIQLKAKFRLHFTIVSILHLWVMWVIWSK
jgi:hypothetical protein